MLLRSAWAAVEPELIGTRSSTASGVLVMTPPGTRRSWPGTRGQAQVLAQRVPGVLGAEHAPLLQQRHHRVGELVQAARGDVRHQDEPVAGVGLDELVDGGGHRGRASR